MKLAAVILAGGLATRLRPITETIPKILVPVAGKPFIYHQLQLLKKAGFHDIYLSLSYLGEQVEAYLAEHQNFGLNIQCLYDGPQLLGTAGAIRRMLSHLPSEFMVVYGDSYLTCDYAAVEKVFFDAKKSALMTVYRNESLWDKSNVIFEEGVILKYDKIAQLPEMKYIDYGLGVFQADVFSSIPENTPYDLAQVYQTQLAENELAAFEVHERFYEVGSLQGIQDLERVLGNCHPGEGRDPRC